MSADKKADLRVGIMSDIHIGFTGHADPRYCGLGQPGEQAKWWEYSLRWFKERGVDAIMIPGDLTNAFDLGKCAFSVEHSRRELRQFADVWKAVFGDTRTELICIYGNHDQYIQAEEPVNGGDQCHWRAAFGEAYSHVVEKTVKGYSFIGAHWGYEKEAGPAVAQAAAKAQGRPVFYFQHGPIKNTTVGSDPTIQHEVFDDGLNNVKDWDNVIAFTGHTHCPITDERAIWQSAAPGAPRCTSVACSTMNYGDMEGPHTARGENLATKHALYMTVTGKTVRLERISFWTDQMRAMVSGTEQARSFERCTRSAGADWVFAVGERPYDLAGRTAASAVPEFPGNARAGVRRGDRFAVVSFPAALPMNKADDLIQSYLVEAVDEQGNVISTQPVYTEHHIDHDESRFSPFYETVVPGLQPDTPYTFRIYARNCYHKRSNAPLTVQTKTLEENGGRQVK